MWSRYFQTRSSWYGRSHYLCYGVATISRLLKIIGLFCKWALWKRPAKETYVLCHITGFARWYKVGLIRGTASVFRVMCIFSTFRNYFGYAISVRARGSCDIYRCVCIHVYVYKYIYTYKYTYIHMCILHMYPPQHVTCPHEKQAVPLFWRNLWNLIR